MRLIALVLLVGACSPSQPGGTGGGGGGPGGGAGGGGGFKAGDPCTGDLTCADSNTGLFCECPADESACLLGIATPLFAPYECKGPAGCNVNGAQAFCDVSGANHGDPCPVLFRGGGRCRAGVTDGGFFMLCTDAGYIAVRCPRRCLESSTQIVCE